MRLFGTAGIRMKYPDELDPYLAMKIGNALGRLNISHRSHVVYDTRVTSPLIALSLSIGLMSTGVDVTLIGLAPTPVAAYAARRNRSIGVSITASHNPPEYNGMKFYDIEGYEFTRNLEEEIERIVEKESYSKWFQIGLFRENNEEVVNYVEDIVGFIDTPKTSWNPVIVVDCANGSSHYVTPEVIRRIGGRPCTFNCNPDGYFPIRPPEPRRDVLENMLQTYSSVNPVTIFAHDGDADRVAVLDPVRGFIRQDRILAFFAKKILEEKKGHVVVSIDTGYVVDEVVYDLGGSIERYLLGKTHERVKELGLSRVIMAGEPWKLIYTKWGPWVDGVIQVALITKSIIESGKPFSKILEEEKIPDYPWDRRSYLIEPIHLREVVYPEIVGEIDSALGDPVRVIDIDGYRFEYKDLSWVLIRKSGTEPKIRVYAESRTQERLREIISTTERIINMVIKKHGGRIKEIMIG